MIQAVIFDMDGVLIDSEPFWQESEIEAFGQAGLTLTREMCLETMGLRVDEIFRFAYSEATEAGSDAARRLQAATGKFNPPAPQAAPAPAAASAPSEADLERLMARTLRRFFGEMAKIEEK